MKASVYISVWQTCISIDKYIQEEAESIPQKARELVKQFNGLVPDYAVAKYCKDGGNLFDIQNKEKRYKGNKFFDDVDEFKAPILNFKSERNFDDLCNKQIKNTDLIIGKAIESIQFKMNEGGVKLKSEATIECLETGLPFEEFVIEPRYFYFDDKFVIFISEEGKKPYFAMKVTDAAGLNNK